MTDVAISVTGVNKYYRVFDDQRSRMLHAVWPPHTKGMQEIWALKDINFEIKRGEAVAIIGRNGGGKSTLLEILTGTLTPTTGEVIVNGRVSALLELGSGFNPEYSGRDNVVLNGLLLGLSREDILGRFAEIEAFAEIGAAIDRPVKTYSSGMVMRLAFAVQVLCDPEILIIDEALSVGDFFFQQKCLSYIRSLCAKGVTLLFVSHDMGTVRDICMRSLYLKKGALQFDGESREAIFRFLAEDIPAPFNTSASEPQDQPDTLAPKNDAFWRADVNEPGKIVAVFIKDKHGVACSDFTVGDSVTISVLFFPHSAAPNHVTIGFTNRYGQLATATGSMQLGNDPAIFKESGVLLTYELDIDLMMESGNYAFEVTLGYETGINKGDRFDKTPSLGPISVVWDFERHVAPFIGSFGLPSRGRFLTGNALE
jgi:lipopolysaccharide transport system ATP-binding protein